MPASPIPPNSARRHSPEGDGATRPELVGATVAGVEHKGDPHRIAIIAADLEPVGALALVGPVDRDPWPSMWLKHFLEGSPAEDGRDHLRGKPRGRR